MNGSEFKTVNLGGYSLLFPTWWSELSQKDSPPLQQLFSIPTQNISFDVTVGPGRAGDLTEFLSIFREGLHGTETRDVTLDVGGVRFEGIRVAAPKEISDNPDAVMEVYAARFQGDLVAFSVSRLRQDDMLEKLRTLCIKIVANSLIKASQNTKLKK